MISEKYSYKTMGQVFISKIGVMIATISTSASTPAHGND
jgi:hypothetical protein